MTVQSSLSRESNMIKLWTYFKRPTGLWMLLTSTFAKETSTISSYSFIIWLSAIRKCRCLKNARLALNKLLNTYQMRSLMQKKKVFQTAWRNYRFFVSLRCSTVPSYLKYTVTRMHYIKPKRVWNYLIFWLMT